MKIKVDTNDSDIKYHKIKINPKDISHIKSVCKALTNLKNINMYNPNKFYNYPTGGRYGITMESICKYNPKDNLIQGGLNSEESFNIFDRYIGRKTFHTIHQIDINDNNLFISKDL